MSVATVGVLVQVPGSSPAPALAPARPKFNSHVTSDRLREGAGLYLPPLFRTASNIRKGRTSVFKEMGLDDHDALACVSQPVSAGVDQKLVGGAVCPPSSQHRHAA